MLNSSTVSSKPRLTKELTTTFIQNFNSKNVSGKALRNKKKPSCLVLDDFCIDYHNTSVDAKLDRKKQYLKPRGKVVHETGQIEKKGQDGNVPSGEIENAKDFPKGKEVNDENLKTHEKVIDMQNSHESNKAVLQEDLFTPKDILNEQFENRYSKRKRSGKPKRYFGSEFDLQPGFEKKLSTQSTVDENRKKEWNSLKSSYKVNVKCESKEELKSHKSNVKESENGQQAKKESHSTIENGNILKRSARIQQKRSRQTDSKPDKTTELESTGTKRRKPDTNQFVITSDLNINTKTAVQNENDNGKRKRDDPSTTCIMSNDGIVKNPSENKEEVKIQRGIANTTKKTTKSPRKANEKSLPQKPATRHLIKQKKVSESGKSEKGGSKDTESYRKDKCDGSTLLCHEPSLQDNYDRIQDLHKKIAVLRQAERILGGKITLLSPQDIDEFEKSKKSKSNELTKNQDMILVNGTSFQVSQQEKGKKYFLVDFKKAGFVKNIGDAARGKSVKIGARLSKLPLRRNDGQETEKEQDKLSSGNMNSTQSCQMKCKNKGKEKDISVPSKIIIDRSKGIVSIQPTTPDEQKGTLDKQGDPLTGDNLLDSGKQRCNKHEPNSVFIVINKRTKGLDQCKSDILPSEVGNDEIETENNHCVEELCSSEPDDNINVSKETSPSLPCHPKSIERREITGLGSSVDDVCLTRENSDMKSIYAKLSFNRLLASVHEETVKTQLRHISDFDKEELCTTNDCSETKVSESKTPNKIEDYSVGIPSTVDTSIPRDDVWKCKKKAKEGDLLLQVLQRSHEMQQKESSTTQNFNKTNIESCSKDILSNVVLNAGTNVSVMQENSSAQGLDLSHSHSNDSQGSRDMPETGRECADGSSPLDEGQNKITNEHIKIGRALLDALNAIKNDELCINERRPQSKVISTHHRQSYTLDQQIIQSSNCKNESELQIDLGTIQRHKDNLFKAKTARRELPSLELISGLRNIEKTMVNLSKQQTQNSGQCSVLGSSDSNQTYNIAERFYSSTDYEFSREDDKRSGLKMKADDECSSLIIEHRVACEDTRIFKVNSSKEMCKAVQVSQSYALPEGAVYKEPRTTKRRRKGMKPKKHTSILRAHPETHLQNESVKATLLQFDGKKSRTHNECSTGLYLMEKEGEGKARKNLDHEAKRIYFPDCDTLKTVYGVGKICKSYKHAKVGVRKYPIPNRSCRRRNPSHCLKFPSKVFPGKDDAEVPNCDAISTKKPNAAREQGEELLKQMLKLNKGILIRQDLKQ